MESLSIAVDFSGVPGWLWIVLAVWLVSEIPVNWIEAWKLWAEGREAWRHVRRRDDA